MLINMILKSCILFTYLSVVGWIMCQKLFYSPVIIGLLLICGCKMIMVWLLKYYDLYINVGW